MAVPESRRLTSRGVVPVRFARHGGYYLKRIRCFGDGSFSSARHPARTNAPAADQFSVEADAAVAPNSQIVLQMPGGSCLLGSASMLDLVIYQAGANPHLYEPANTLGPSTSQLYQRDR
jgi:hypothetical protein